MAAVETGGVSRLRLSTSIYARSLLLVTLLLVTAMLMATSLITSTSLTGNPHCAAEADNRKRQQSRSENGSETATDISTSGRWRFVVNNDRLCDAVVDDDGVTSLPVYVVTVHSRPGQRGRMQRDAIRVTWGSSLHRRVAEPDIRLAFVLGRDRKCVASSSSSSAR